jgi:hypothetical protein
MVGKDIYTNCGTVGQTGWLDGEAGWSGPTEKPAIPNGQAGQTDTRMGARRRAHGCPTETGSCPTEGSMCARRRAGSRGVAQHVEGIHIEQH